MPDEAIPESVLNELDERTIKRYLSDSGFRRALLTDPSACNRDEELGLSGTTIDWINERVRHHGLRHLLAETPDDIVPM